MSYKFLALVLTESLPTITIVVGSIYFAIRSFLNNELSSAVLSLILVWASFLILRRAWRRYWFEEELKGVFNNLKQRNVSQSVYFNHAVTARDRNIALAFSEAIKANERRFRSLIKERIGEEAILRSMEEAVLVLDLEERVVQVNRAAEELFNITSKNAIGRTIQEVVMLAPLHRFIRQLLDVSEKEFHEGDLSILSSKDKYLQMTGSRIVDRDGATTGLIVVFNDVTKMRSLERARSDFIGNVSHELKTPITSIRGFGETLLDGALDKPEDARRFVGIIVKQAERLGRIFEDMLTLSRLEGEQVSEKTRQDISALILSVIQACEISASAKRSVVKGVCQPGLMAEINTELMEQALINLLENAIKYSPDESEISIEVSEEDGKLSIAVIDNGPGIDEAHHARIFERFYRVDKGRSRAGGGTGLGLAIVKHIAQAHGGIATVESRVGQGSKFAVLIPIQS